MSFIVAPDGTILKVIHDTDEARNFSISREDREAMNEKFKR